MVLLSERTDLVGALAKLGGDTDPSRVILETKSTNTHENAIYGASLLRPTPQERWLLVTGALHMPRALASFEKAGFRIEPWPVYGATSEASIVPSAMHEWIGLISYRVLGRTKQLFPM